MKFGQLVIRKITKIIATRCHILRLKCTNFDSGWGSAPDPAGPGELTMLPQLDLRGQLLTGGEGEEGKKGERIGGGKKGGEEKEGSRPSHFSLPSATYGREYSLVVNLSKLIGPKF